MKQNRFRSKAAWLVTIAVVGGVVKHYIPGISVDYQIITDAGIALATVWGVFNDPTSKGQF